MNLESKITTKLNKLRSAYDDAVKNLNYAIKDLDYEQVNKLSLRVAVLEGKIEVLEDIFEEVEIML